MVRYYSGRVRLAVSKVQQFLGSLLCALVLIASIDRVPDPPSLKPQHDTAISFGASCHHSPVADQGRSSDLAPHQEEAQCFLWNALSAEKLLPSLIRLDQASDSSPPHPPS